MTHRVFVAFAGGGAKGLVHVGALKALAERGVTIDGFAGTSAGAIVASLAAAGYVADQLVDASTGVSLVAQLERINPRFYSATAIFGSGGWTRIDFLRQLLVDLTPGRALVGLLVWIGLGAVWVVSAPEGVKGYPAAAAWLLANLTIVGLAAVTVLKGLANLKDFRDALDILLREKLLEPGAGRSVCFEDFNREGRPTLKIVASDISNRKMQVFSPTTTPKVAVADAVAASVCLPLIFEPWRIDGRFYVDGGLVSNLPAWPFDEERELDPDALTIAFDIESRVRLKPLKWWTWLPSAIETALSGAGELNTRGMRRGLRFDLKTDLDLLAFDMRPSEAAESVRSAYAAAQYVIDREIFAVPRIYQEACDAVLKLVETTLANAPIKLFNMAPARLRVGVALKDPGRRQSLRLKFGAGFQATDRDLDLCLPIEGSVVGAAWTSGKPWLERFRFSEAVDLQGPRLAALRRCVWPDLGWTLCVPIFGADKGSPALVVTVDGCGELRRSDNVDAFMIDLSVAVVEFFNPVMIQLER